MPYDQNADLRRQRNDQRRFSIDSITGNPIRRNPVVPNPPVTPYSNDPRMGGTAGNSPPSQGGSYGPDAGNKPNQVPVGAPGGGNPVLNVQQKPNPLAGLINQLKSSRTHPRPMPIVPGLRPTTAGPAPNIRNATASTPYGGSGRMDYDLAPDPLYLNEPQYTSTVETGPPESIGGPVVSPIMQGISPFAEQQMDPRIAWAEQNMPDWARSLGFSPARFAQWMQRNPNAQANGNFNSQQQIPLGQEQGYNTQLMQQVTPANEQLIKILLGAGGM